MWTRTSQFRPSDSILLELIWWKIFTLIFWYKSTRVEHYAGKAEYRMHQTNRCARRSKIYLSWWSESIKYELCFDVKQLMINLYKYYSYDNIGCNTKDISPSLCDCTFVLYLVHIIIFIWFDYLNTYIKRNVLRFRVINRSSRVLYWSFILYKVNGLWNQLDKVSLINLNRFNLILNAKIINNVCLKYVIAVTFLWYEPQ